MNKQKIYEERQAPLTALQGFCSTCQKNHVLTEGNCRELARELMDLLQQQKHLSLRCTDSCDPRYSTQSLFGDSRGKMFGVLQGVDKRGNLQTLYAFSGQFNGLWNIPGWVPPLFDEQIWRETNYEAEKQIKALSKRLAGLPVGCPEYMALRKQRKKQSQNLMTRIHALYLLRNHEGQYSTLAPFFPDRNGIPTGTGDCCAPKLLNHALRLEIIPFGMAEFYWGRTNKSGTRKHGSFYPACDDKCKPLLGFLLCGIEEQQRLITSCR